MKKTAANTVAYCIRPILAATITLATLFTLSCENGNSYAGTGGKGNGISNYKTVTIGNQTWMAENLNYDVEGSKCYDNLESNCDTYGRLYNWATAKIVCPSGWHLPAQAEWNALSSYVQGAKGCSNCDAKHLKAASGWNNNSNGEDTYDFAALPGGEGNASNGEFYNIGRQSYWWSATGDKDLPFAAILGINDYELSARWDYALIGVLLSVRCLQD